MSYIDFYVDPVNGDNRNSGSKAAAVPYYTTVNGSHSNSTHIFTPTDGSNPVVSGLAAGDFVSIFADAAAVTGYVTRVVSVVNATNGAITTAAGSAAGAEPTGAGMTLRAGGCWKGPNGTVGFPFSMSRLGTLLPIAPGIATDTTRINLRTNATYSLTTNFTLGGTQNVPYTVEAYVNTPGDIGYAHGPRAIFTSTLDNVFNTGGGSAGGNWRHIQFSTTATTGIQSLVIDNSGLGGLWFDCIFKDARGNGFDTSSGIAIECEAVNCNRCNQESHAGFNTTNYKLSFVRCYSHDHTGLGSHGFMANGSITSLLSCIAARCSGCGLAFGSGAVSVFVENCDFYNNGRAGIGLQSGGTNNGKTLVVENCNFLKNVGGAIKLPNVGTSGQWSQGLIFNCGYGTGTMANGADDIGNMQVVGQINYPANSVPWLDPDNGDFRIVLSIAISAGRGGFIAGATIGYPDIGAAQHQDGTALFWSGSQYYEPDGYIGHHWNLTGIAGGAFDDIVHTAGTMPPGVILSHPSPNVWQLDGIPTALGTFDFTLGVVYGGVLYDGARWRVTIYPDPSGISPPPPGGGTGGAGGGPPEPQNVKGQGGRPTDAKGQESVKPEPTERVKIVYRDQDITALVNRARTAAQRQENMVIVGPGVSKTEDGHFMINP